MSIDAIVVGLGAAGSAVLHQLAKRNVKSLGLDRFTPPHDHGSSHGFSRITRNAVGEGEIYVPLVLRSREIWREIEAVTGVALFERTGGLIMAPQDKRIPNHGQTDFFESTLATAHKFNIPHEILSAEEIAYRYRQFIVPNNLVGFLEPDGGILTPENCIRSELEIARRAGATIRTNETVIRIEHSAKSVTITTDRSQYEADHVVLAAGPWLPALARDVVGEKLKVYRQVQFWFEAEDSMLWSGKDCPFFIWLDGNGTTDCISGYPMTKGSSGVKIGNEQYTQTADPNLGNKDVERWEISTMYSNYIAKQLRGLGPTCIRAMPCFYTVSRNSKFLIDRHPLTNRVTLLSACSGHGFKHSAAIGEAVAEWIIDGASKIDLEPFSLKELQSP
jgi:sarcosine oxidase